MYIYWSHEDNPMQPSSSSLQWLCDDMPDLDGQWQSLYIDIVF